MAIPLKDQADPWMIVVFDKSFLFPAGAGFSLTQGSVSTMKRKSAVDRKSAFSRAKAPRATNARYGCVDMSSSFQN